MKTLKQLSEQLKDRINQFIETTDNNENSFERTTAEMKNRFQEAKKLVAIAIAKEQMLKSEYQQAIVALDISKKKAEIVSQSQHSENNIDAQQQVTQHQNRVNELEQQMHAQEAIVTDLTVLLKEFYQQFRSISIDLDNLYQRQQQSKTRADFNKLFAEFDLSDANNAIHQAKEELKKTEAEAKKWEKHNQRKRNQSENKKDEDFNVDEALAALKRDILGSSQND